MTSIDPKVSGAASDYLANVRRRLLETLLQTKASTGVEKTPDAQAKVTPEPRLPTGRPQNMAYTRAASAAIESRLALELANPTSAGAAILDDAASVRITSRYLAEGEAGPGRADIRPPDPQLMANATVSAPVRPDVISLLTWLSSGAMRPLSGDGNAIIRTDIERAPASSRLPRHDGPRGNVGAVALSIALATTLLIVALILT